MAGKVLSWCHATLRNTSLTCCEETFAVDDEGWLDPQPTESAVKSLCRIPGFSQKVRGQAGAPAPAAEAPENGDDISSPPSEAAPKTKQKAAPEKVPAKKAASKGVEKKSSPPKKAPAKSGAKSTKTQAAAKKSAAKSTK